MNPFEVSMVRLQLPPGSGPNISLRGFTLEADEEGTVTVPKDAVASLVEAHGLKPYVEKAVAKGK